MKALTGVLVLLVLAVLGTACGDKAAVDRAEAYAIQKRADMQAEATRFAMQVEQAARATAQARQQTEWEAKLKTDTATDQLFDILWTLIIVGAAVFIIGVGAYALSSLFLKLADATGQYAQAQAELQGRIKLLRPDRDTMALPAIVVKEAVHDPNTGLVLLLGEPREPNPQLTAGHMHKSSIRIASASAERIAKSTKDSQAGDTISTVAGVLPLVNGTEPGADQSGAAPEAGAGEPRIVRASDVDGEIIDM